VRGARATAALALATTPLALAMPALALAAALLVPARTAGAELMDYEYGAALVQLGRLRMLTERLSKQNVLYQLHLADQHKLDLIETAGGIQETLDLLRSGRPLMAVPRPPSGEIAAQLGRIDAAWQPLQRMARASPFEYLRRSREFIEPRDDRGDPLMILHFDDLARALVAEGDRASELYVATCKAAGWERCDLAAVAGIPSMLAERIVKEAVLVFAGMEVEANRARLEATRKQLDQKLAVTGGSEVLAGATAATRGSPGAYAAGLWKEVAGAWRRLDDELELVVRGHAEEGNLRRAVSLQVLLVDDMQRLAAALEQYAAAGPS